MKWVKWVWLAACLVNFFSMLGHAVESGLSSVEVTARLGCSIACLAMFRIEGVERAVDGADGGGR